jgi:RNA polymerase sigma-54 factor
MAMEARLALRQTQRLVMTPMLQQAIHLLQLSTVELQELLQKELEENPLLEEAPPDEAPGPEGDGETQGEAAPDNPQAEATATPSTTEPGAVASDLPFDISEVIFGPPEERSLVQQEEQEDTRFENFVGTPTSLADHLDEQLRLTVVEPEVRTAAEEIIGNLDEDGYLRATIDEVAAKRSLPLPVVNQALTLVQGFDPIGVAARDLRECLLLQLRDPTRTQPASPLAIEILDQHFDALQRCKYPEIARLLKVDQERVIEAVHEIATLEPKPGRRFASVETRYVVPDVLVKKVGDDYAIILNEDGMPRLRVNPYYRNVIGQGDEARRYVEDRMRSAIWLIKSIHQRQKTLYKVTNSIVQFQKAFLDKGLPHLRPLSLRDVAEDIRMHESTVSRVTTSKFVETPQGVLPLKFFFHSGIAKTQGDEVSSVSVKKMIEDLVAKEELTKPLSDQDITRALRQEGLTIARRTVAKYREELGILPSHQRRLAVRKRA